MMVRSFITTICLLLLSLLPIGMIGGCGFSTSVPQEQYIQIDYPTIKQTDVVDAQTPVIMIRDFNSLPAFDRSAIMFSQDGVLMSAAFLYWEGSPAEILAHYFAYGLNASGEFRTLHPYSPTNRDAEVLRGRVLSFEVDKTAMAFRITFSASLWKRSERNLAQRRNIHRGRTNAGFFSVPDIHGRQPGIAKNARQGVRLAATVSS